jgi:diaminohydroxyphosphoribosylaminopyrimidine deaminase/5-amino-6-(5-phosphoribosylamino)uracil reductase
MIEKHGPLDAVRMREALALADRARGLASPNPPVGAVIYQGNRRVAWGYHARFGGPHAEAVAISRAGRRAKGGTLYVTLEPCSTWAKTPPCTRAIVHSGLKRVVIASLDPNPKHHGRGVRLLRSQGIRVTSGVLGREADRRIEAFRKWITSGLPFVTLKMAETLDGKIATARGNSRWISGPASRRWVHALRSISDAVLVGKRTVMQDNPRLSARASAVTRQPWRIVLNTKADLPVASRIFRSDALTILVCGEPYLTRALKRFGARRVSILAVPVRAGLLDLGELVRRLGRLGVQTLLVEGGGEVAAGFLEHGLVDKLHFLIAPSILGGRHSKTSVEGSGALRLAARRRLRDVRYEALGEDLLVTGYCGHVYGNHRSHRKN